MSSPPEATAQSDFSGPLRGSGSPLERGTLGALDELLQVLTPQPVGADRFRAGNEAVRFGRIFGGQLVAQAMAAAAATVAELIPHSIHASFLRLGDFTAPLDIIVERTRDGRSMSVRHVVIEQDGNALVTATVSFDANAASADVHTAAGPATPPESVPLLQHWAQYARAGLAGPGRTWIDRPPPLEMRIGEAPIFLGGAQAPGQRTHWIRLPRTVDAGPQEHAALLAYASDYLLVDMALRSHPQRVGYATHRGLTLDHTIWLHRPVQFDRWHCYTLQTVAVGGHRALVQGTIVDAAGRHVASTAQEVLVRPTTNSTAPARIHRKDQHQ
ncbi:acyl-CoA thioesterase II [Mycolicibacter terrae]|uniref:Acyl-CoA thioesterase II n=1 Tax=Mycolicibacter terrae TaxID=1788 RepID=A0AAD1I0I0_9MYCO|nr:acyl-CoA thioesterase domain-containing protein [Mycolicibacter terrae]ORW95227.1 acyl-CoA thioesterase II [Mycolicibacter terrae]BBX24699.1 acyl-CoA thioesterase II [Mycolicibacter terrae]SNV95812.1 acyl-CoA thioesterase [Mycolicibacter terrae]